MDWWIHSGFHSFGSIATHLSTLAVYFHIFPVAQVRTSIEFHSANVVVGFVMDLVVDLDVDLVVNLVVDLVVDLVADWLKWTWSGREEIMNGQEEGISP